MPAAAVIPAPLAYTIIVAVKRLVVGLNCRLKYLMRVILLFATHVCSVTQHYLAAPRALALINVLSFDTISFIRDSRT